MKSFWNPPNLTLANLDLLAWIALSFLLLTHNFICESHCQSLQDKLCWAFPDTKPPLCDFKQSTAAQPVLPITVHDCIRKIPPLKKIVKTENSKATSGKKVTLCCYQPQLIFLCSCPMGLNSLYSKGWFQLTCYECPKWVTAVNSISAICCPLGHFWTAAGLQCQLLTGNMVGLTQLQKGKRRRGREGEEERINSHVSSQRRLTTLFFSIDYGGNTFWRSENAKPSLSHSLCFVSYYFTHEVGLGFYIESMCWCGNLQPIRCHPISTFFRHIHLIFQTQKWIFPLLWKYFS